MASITVRETSQTPFSPFIGVPNGLTMPSTVRVVRILAVSYHIICLVTAILAQIEVSLTSIKGRWRQDGDIETRPIPQNPLYVSLKGGWRPLKQWIGHLMAPHTHTPVKAGPHLQLQVLGL